MHFYRWSKLWRWYHFDQCYFWHKLRFPSIVFFFQVSLKWKIEIGNFLIWRHIIAGYRRWNLFRWWHSCTSILWMFRTPKSHYSDVIWGSWCVKSPETQLSVRQFIQANTQENKAPRYWPLVRGIYQSLVYFPYIWPLMQKKFPRHDLIMCSSHLECWHELFVLGMICYVWTCYCYVDCRNVGVHVDLP